MFKPWHLVPVIVVLAMGFALGEFMGWPFLAEHLENQLQKKMGRSLRLGDRVDNNQAQVALHFWGGIHLQSPLLEIGAPTWSRAPYLLSAQDVDVRLRYADVWHAWHGQQLVVQCVVARHLTTYLERTADGRANWQLVSDGTSPSPPQVQSMAVRTGYLHYIDVPRSLNLDAELTLRSLESNNAIEQAAPSHELRVSAQGRYRQEAFHGSLQSTGALPWDAEALAGQDTSAAVKLQISLGRTSLDFEGSAKDLLHLKGLDGAFRVQGPSLAAIGEPLGITLPSTPAFKASGHVQRNEARWTLALGKAEVGSSQLSGNFVLDTAAKPSRLSGVLNGTHLRLVDLGPVVGVPVSNKRVPHAKVLPTRPFDLAALRAMDADIHIAIQQFDTNTTLLEPLRPFAAHLTLNAGILTLSNIEARTAQGHLGGTLSLNGQRNIANWMATLNWDGVQLQRWIHQQRAAGKPPYVTGQLQGYAKLDGRGRSTSEILGTLHGDIGATVVNGTLSHLLIEMGGLDLAESLGVYLQGDHALVLDCALADLNVTAGTLRPRLLVLDTSDSTIWVDGTLSLVTETLDLRAVVAPKDFSVLTLRSPLHIQGSFAHPVVVVEKGPLGMKLGLTLLLGLMNPLAGILPLMDVGNTKDAEVIAANCRERMQKKTPPALPASVHKR